MRLSEKTIELNICSQLGLLNPLPPLIWFGLTQKQEAKAGFDACTRFRGRLIIFQFKASNKIVRGKRRFNLNHDQLDNLRNRCRPLQRSIFYVFPMIGNTQELSQNHCFLGASWLLDVDKLKSLPQPMKPDGNLRKSRIHYADVKPPYVVIHSEPVRFSMLNLFEYSLFGFPDAEGVQNLFDEFEKFWEFCSFLHRTSAGLLIPDYQTV